MSNHKKTHLWFNGQWLPVAPYGECARCGKARERYYADLVRLDQAQAMCRQCFRATEAPNPVPHS